MSKGYWPLPSKGDVACAECIGNHAGKLTAAMPKGLGLVGRFLDSQATQDYQQPFRTARAMRVVGAPERNRLYMIIGSAAFAYDLSAFIARLQNGEGLEAAIEIPVGGSYPWTRLHWDAFLKPDAFFYAENEPNGWQIQITDGQERLYGIDYDDQGYIYMAYSFYGWGIAKDRGADDGDLMQSLYQAVPGSFDDEVYPLRIASVKTSDGRYYALVNGGAWAVNIFDVTDRASPIRKPTIQRGFYSLAKTNHGHIAITTPDHKLQIFRVDDYVNGGEPIAQFSAIGAGATMQAVTSDGSTFWATNESSDELILSSFTPASSGYTRKDYPAGKAGGTVNIRYGEGYLTWTGSTNGPMNLRLFRLQNGVPVELDFGDYFQRYYIAPADAEHTTPNFAALYDSMVIKRDDRAYLIATAYSLGDVYEIVGAGPVDPTPPRPEPPNPPPPPPPPPRPPPPPPPPNPQAGCPPIVPGQNMFIKCSAPSGGNQNHPVFKIGEQIRFEVVGFNYDFGCGRHSFYWNLVDPDSGNTGQTAFRTFSAAGTFLIQCTVMVEGQQSLITQAITVEGQPSPPPEVDLLLDLFALSVTWKDHDGNTGKGTRVVCAALGNQTALFWFFSPTNIELAVKAIDGQALNGHWWIFYGSLTDVEFTLTVTDKGSGRIKNYRNESGKMASVGDTEAF